MANQECLNILLSNDQRRWDKFREKSSQEDLDFSGFDFSRHYNRNWRDYNFSGANFSNTILENFQAPNANLSNCIFDEAKITNSNFSSAEIKNSSFVKSKISDSIFSDCILNGSVFEEASVNGRSSFHNCQMYGVKFIKGSISDAGFNSAKFVDPENSKVFSTFSCVLLRNINAPNIDLSYCNFDAVNFSNFQSSNLNLIETNFICCEFSQGNIKKSKFEKCNFQGSKFYKTALPYNDFNKSRFTDVYFEKNDLTSSVFEKSDLLSTKFISVILNDTKWPKSKIGEKTYFENPDTTNENVMVDRTDEVLIPFPHNIINWSHIRWTGQLPLFGFSWVTLLIALFIVNMIYYFNSVPFQYDIPYPPKLKLLILGSLLLAFSVTIYKVKCPKRIQTFSENHWVEELKHFRLLYAQESLKQPAWRILSYITLILGAAISLYLIGERLVFAFDQLCPDLNFLDCAIKDIRNND